MDPKAQNKRVQFNKPLPVLEQRDQHKYPSKVIEVEEADPALKPKPKKKVVIFVDELYRRQQEPNTKRTRAQNPSVTKVLTNMLLANKSSIDLTDLFNKFLMAVPALVCFVPNAPVVMNPPERLLNGLQMSDILLEL